jgi:hypothetical protein
MNVENLSDEVIDIFQKFNRGEKLSPDEIRKLPLTIQQFAKVESPPRTKRACYNLAMHKMKNNERLNYEDMDILKEYGHPTLQLDGSVILNDVVNGEYSFSDVPSMSHDLTPIKFLEQIVSQFQEKSYVAVKKIDASLADGNVISTINQEKMNDIVESSVTGLDIATVDKMNENEANIAINSLIRAEAMFENEKKIMEVIEGKKSFDRETLAEAAVAASMFSDSYENSTDLFKSDEKPLAFEISNTSFDISFIPSNDPDVHKPLEVISYLAMTK